MDTVTTDFENWGPYLMKQFQLMYEKGERCDLEISCNKQIFLVHRLIMASCSEYVRELGDKQHLILPDEVSCKAVRCIIDFAYTGKIVFCKDEKDDILLASNLLNMRLLTELIKLEESCSFTLSMDDDGEETSKSNENASNNLNVDLSESTDLAIDEQPDESTASPTVKKKAEVRSGRPRGNRNAVLPPLFKFPYLQQKFSSSRTYGLITNLTDPGPSRFDIPESILESCTFRSSFEDVTYETAIFCPYESMCDTLQPAHLQFLKKVRESPGQRRSYSNALFSPFDKYAPPCNMNAAEMHAPKKREAITSYLSAAETPARKKLAPAPRTWQTPKKSVTFAKDLETIVECPSSYGHATKDLPTNRAKSAAPSVGPHQSLPTVFDRAPTPDVVDASLEMAMDATSDIDMQLPAPISPVANISDDVIRAPFVESGEKVELTRLNNVAVSMDVDELQLTLDVTDEFHPQLSTATAADNAAAAILEPSSQNGCTSVEPVPPSSCEVVTAKKADEVADEAESMHRQHFSIVNETETTLQRLTAAAVLEKVPLDANRTETETTTKGKLLAAVSELASAPSVIPAIVTTAEINLETPPTITSTTLKTLPTAGSVAGSSQKKLASLANTVDSTRETIPTAADWNRSSSAADAATIQLTLSADNSLDEATQLKPPSSDSVANNAPEQPPTVTITDNSSPKRPSTNTGEAESAHQTFSSISDASANVVAIFAPELKNLASNVPSAPAIICEASNLPGSAKEAVTVDNSAPAAGPSTSCGAATPMSDDSVTNSVDSILSDSNMFTAIDKKCVSQISTDPNSQIFALKVKGTENSTQLSQLVDMCKKNPLFKNKNVKFKIVPVKGPIPKTLQEHAQLSSTVLNKAIIVQRTANLKSDNRLGEGGSSGASASASASASAVSAAVAAAVNNATKVAAAAAASAASRRRARVPSIENATGPWECGLCGNPTPLKFGSYFEYRTHLHDVHDEANNPIYCVHCGHKCVKRNMQLYHLFTKHGVPPPSNLQFPKCDKCEFHALNDYYLQKHQSCHQSAGMEYVCSCKVAFRTSELLQQHMASNDCKNSNSFSCGYCNSQFDRFVNLKAHMRVCMKERSKPILQNTEPASVDRIVNSVLACENTVDEADVP